MRTLLPILLLLALALPVHATANFTIVNAATALQTAGATRIDADGVATLSALTVSGHSFQAATDFSADVTLTSGAAIKKLRLENQASDPSSPNAGQLYYKTGDAHGYIYNGSAFVKLFQNVGGDEATTGARGLMSAADKTTLNSIAAASPKAGTVATAGNALTGTVTFNTAFSSAPVVTFGLDQFNMLRIANVLTSSFDWELEANPDNATINWNSSGASNP